MRKTVHDGKLLSMAVFEGRLMVTNLLLKKADKLDLEVKEVPENDRKSTLHLAIMNPDMGPAEMSLRHGPNVSRQDRMGYRSLRSDILLVLTEAIFSSYC